MRHRTFRRRGRRRAGALTLVECVVATLIVAVSLVAALHTVGGARTGERRLDDSQAALVLAEDLLAEIAAQPYADANDSASVFGPTATEAAAGNRSLFNDVNDYRDWSESPPAAKDGNSLGFDSTWRRAAQIEFLDPSDAAAASATDRGLARVTVVVSRNQIPLVTLVTIRSAGLPATESCQTPDGNWHNLAPAHSLALGATSEGPGTNVWTRPDSQAGLVALWAMDESSGTTATDAIAGRVATLLNGAMFKDGRFGHSLSLDGNEDYAVVPHDDALSIDSTITLAAWVYLDVLPKSGSGYYIMLSKGGSSSTWNYSLDIWGDCLGFDFMDVRGHDWYCKGGKFTRAKTWYHCAATCDWNTGNVRLYLNGALTWTARANNKPEVNASNLLIGRDSAGYYMNGRIDDVRVYNRVLSDAEIQTLYNGGEP
jgi:type II secretory pathway pseudopilin PulG